MKKHLSAWPKSDETLLEAVSVNRPLPKNMHFLSPYWKKLFTQISVQIQPSVRLLEGGAVELDTDAVVWSSFREYHLDHHEYSEVRVLMQKVDRLPLFKEFFIHPRGTVRRLWGYFKAMCCARSPAVYFPDDRPALLLWDSRLINVYHWLVDSLARLSLMRDVSVKPYIVLPAAALNRDYVLDTLRAFGYSLDDVLIMKLGSRYLIKHLQVLSPAILATGACCDSLVRHVQETLVVEKPHVNKLLYLARKPELGRAIINSDEFESLLAQYGFQKIYPEDYLFSDLQEMLGETVIMMAVYSASLAHAVLMPRGSHMIEIAAHDFIAETPPYWGDNYHSNVAGDYYYSLSVACGHHYHLIPCEKKDSNQYILEADIHVDIELLRKTIELALKL